MRIGPLFALGLLTAVPAPAATIVVPDSVSTIAGALATAASGDSVLVQPGTYPEIVVLVDGVTLAAAVPADRPVLDGGGAGPVLTATNCGSGTIISGFVIRNGVGGGTGGGLKIANGAPRIESCRFESNAAVHGGAVGATASSFTITACEFEGNSASQTGGAVSAAGAASPAIWDCRFVGNDALAGGAIAVRNGCTPEVDASLLDGNQADQGGGIWYDILTGGTLTGCTLVHNDATSGLGSGLFLNSPSSTAVSECILSLGVNGGAIHAVAGSAATFGCCVLWGNAGGNALVNVVDLGTNLWQDPEFCDAPGGTYTLRDTSPCLPGGGCGLIGAFGAGGCGPVSAGSGVETLSWGGVKALYR
jgi:predicted outer membrane repeat protein